MDTPSPAPFAQRTNLAFGGALRALGLADEHAAVVRREGAPAGEGRLEARARAMQADLHVFERHSELLCDLGSGEPLHIVQQDYLALGCGQPSEKSQHAITHLVLLEELVGPELPVVVSNYVRLVADCSKWERGPA